MKKYIAMILAGVIMLALTACGATTSNATPTFAKIEWPGSAIASLLPVPESSIGRISSDYSDQFIIYVGETSREQYDAYVDECKKKGFTLIIGEGDNNYYANNEAGYELSLMYQDNSTMYIAINEPHDEVAFNDKESAMTSGQPTRPVDPVTSVIQSENANFIINRSSDELVGENYQTVISELETIGFTNITTVVLDDLITGWFTNDEEVEQVDINGTTEFSAYTSFPKDAKIVVTYHTFPKESDTEPTAIESSGPSTGSNQEILTAENNEDLATLLVIKDPTDPFVSEFAEKYAGKTIEFDGCIANVSPHDGYTTRFDYLIYPGDFSIKSAIGPQFQFKDVNYNDLHLTGANIPDTFGVGLNIHIVAEIGEYNNVSGLFSLKPVSVSIR